MAENSHIAYSTLKVFTKVVKQNLHPASICWDGIPAHPICRKSATSISSKDIIHCTYHKKMFQLKLETRQTQIKKNCSNVVVLGLSESFAIKNRFLAIFLKIRKLKLWIWQGHDKANRHAWNIGKACQGHALSVLLLCGLVAMKVRLSYQQRVLYQKTPQNSIRFMH